MKQIYLHFHKGGIMEENVVNEIVETVKEEAPTVVESVEQVKQAIEPVKVPEIVMQISENKIFGMSDKTFKDILVLGTSAAVGATALKVYQVAKPKVVNGVKAFWKKLTAPKTVVQAQSAPAAQTTVEAQTVQTVATPVTTQENK